MLCKLAEIATIKIAFRCIPKPDSAPQHSRFKKMAQMSRFGDATLSGCLPYERHTREIYVKRQCIVGIIAVVAWKNYLREQLQKAGIGINYLFVLPE